jgi:hypothetical protein
MGNWLKGLVLPLVKGLIKSNVNKLDLLQPQFEALLARELPAENAKAVAESLVEATKAEVVKWIDKI